MRTLIGMGALGLILAGCATAEVPTSLPPIDAMIAAPDPIPGRDWHLAQHHGQSSLAFGVAESDDVDMGLTCEDGSGQVTLFRDAAPGEAQDFHLETGREVAHLAAEGEPSPLTDGLALVAETGVDQPVFRDFSDLGWMALWSGGERHGFAAHPGSEGRIARFFAACDRASS